MKSKNYRQQITKNLEKLAHEIETHIPGHKISLRRRILDHSRIIAVVFLAIPVAYSIFYIITHPKPIIIPGKVFTQNFEIQKVINLPENIWNIIPAGDLQYSTYTANKISTKNFIQTSQNAPKLGVQIANYDWSDKIPKKIEKETTKKPETTTKIQTNTLRSTTVSQNISKLDFTAHKDDNLAGAIRTLREFRNFNTIDIKTFLHQDNNPILQMDKAHNIAQTLTARAANNILTLQTQKEKTQENMLLWKRARIERGEILEKTMLSGNISDLNTIVQLYTTAVAEQQKLEALINTFEKIEINLQREILSKNRTIQRLEDRLKLIIQQG